MPEASKGNKFVVPVAARKLLLPIYKVAAITMAAIFVGGVIAVGPTPIQYIGLVAVWLVSGAAGGAFLGLLFGVPKRNKDGGAPAVGGATDAASKAKLQERSSYAGNSNFEEISDWLTKVIVGATLVSLHSALSTIWTIAKSMLPFGEMNQAAGASLVVGAGGTGLVAGFISMYLWSRNELPNILSDAEKPTTPMPVTSSNVEVYEKNVVDEREQAQEGVQRALETGRDVQPATTKTFRPTGQAAWIGEMTGLTATEIWERDFNLDKFGGSATTATRVLSAVVGKITDRYVEVTLTVKSRDPSSPLKGRVIFYLHPTFTQPIITIEAVDSCAKTVIRTVDAFVVGVECDEGRTVLELDLATVDGFPASRVGDKKLPTSGDQRQSK